MTYTQRQNRITTGFLLLSLLLHLLLLFLPKQWFVPLETIPEPVVVEVRPSQPRERELDIPLRKELEKPRETPAKRLAEKDQVVKREQAPEGKHLEEQSRSVRTESATPRPQPAPRPQPTPAPTRPEPKPAEPPVPEPSDVTPVTPEGWKPPPTEKPAPTRQLPSLDTLTQLSPGTLAQLETDWRTKYRADVEKGDTVWMDTEQDLLISFMRRFRDNIYGVWNYPFAAAQRAEKGTCLIRVTIDRKGNVTNIQLLESSGFRDLDEEAMRAVREGATYGPLPRAYPHDDLKIMAFFQYNLGPTVIREKRRRPGDIF